MVDGAKTSSRPILQIVQHEPCWAIQSYLRFCDVPYEVTNTPYHRLDGGSAAYPLLIDDRTATSDVIFYIPSPIRGGGGAYSYLKETQVPPSASAPSKKGDCDGVVVGSEILSHIRRSYKDLDAAIDPSTTEAWLSLLETVLSPILLALTFADDGPGYTSFRQHWLSASQILPPTTSFTPSSPLSFFFGIASSLRLFAEKSTVIKSLRPPGGLGGGVIPQSPLRSRAGGYPAVDVPVALTRASRAYAALSSQLLRPSSSSGPYMFGGLSPSLTDALLFDHVAGALANPHMSPVIQSYPLLLAHFRRIVDEYFPAIASPSPSSPLLPDGSSVHPPSPPSRFASGDSANDSNAFCNLRSSYLLVGSNDASGVLSPAPPTPRDLRRFRRGAGYILRDFQAVEGTRQDEEKEKEKGNVENRVWFAAVSLLVVGFFVS